MLFWGASIGIAVVALIGFLPNGGSVWFWTKYSAAWLWIKYSAHQAAIAPLLTLAAGVALAGVALLRHFAQTEADRQRRITESFSKAIEQLGSDKVEVRLGGIYSLERISKESPSDYWTVIENLTAFVRERSQRMEPERTERVTRRAYFLWLEAGRPEQGAGHFWAAAEILEQLPTDIAAAITVLMRRRKWGRKREIANGWCLDLRGANLRLANLSEGHFERARLDGAHLEGARLDGAHLQRASLDEAHLEVARLDGAHLGRARLDGAHLEGARLIRTHLQRARLDEARLEGASLHGADFERASLYDAHLEEANLDGANLEGASLDGAHLEGARLNGANLQRAGLDGAHLQRAGLNGANLEGASLNGAHLEGASLNGAHLEGASLNGAHLEGASLDEVHLEGASPEEAHLSGKRALQKSCRLCGKSD
jgi:uncharacterized protein YjbI with pentapeptide repeats